VPPDTTQPSLIVDSSTGNFRYWLFLREAVDAKLGQQLGERIRKALGCGHDTGNVVQPYRVAGTVNYPNNKKIACAYTLGCTRRPIKTIFWRKKTSRPTKCYVAVTHTAGNLGINKV
jgi:hypothetical protein